MQLDRERPVFRMNVTCGHCGALHWSDELLSDSSKTTSHFEGCKRVAALQTAVSSQIPCYLTKLTPRNRPPLSSSHITIILHSVRSLVARVRQTTILFRQTAVVVRQAQSLAVLWL